MSSEQSNASQQALATNKQLAGQYYGTAIPALQTQMQSINQSLAKGEPNFLEQAYGGQRSALTEGIAAAGGAKQAQQFGLGKNAMSGGNQFASLHPADVGAQLANALYGSKFQEGQANLNQQFNLMSMGLGGSGTAGNAALTASGNQLQAIGYLPNYNQTYANVVGGAAGLSSLYGAYNQWNAGQPAAGGLAGVMPTNPASGATGIA